MKSTTITAVYNRKNKLLEDGTALVQIRVFADKMKYISTGVYLKPEEWNEKEKKVKTSNKNHYALNRKIKDVINDVEEFERKMILSDQIFTINDLTNHLKNRSSDSDSYLDYYWKELNDNRKLDIKTYNSHKNTYNKLKEYNKIHLFNDLTYKNISNLEKWLIDNYRLANNTLWGIHKNIKIYINLAIKEGKMRQADNPYNDFKSTYKKTNKDYLISEEIKSIEELNFNANDLSGYKKIRDIFLFACYTGLRFTDVMELNMTKINITSKGMEYINQIQDKTENPVNLPLYKLFGGKPQRIIEAYRDGDKINFSMTNQYVNRTLKHIAVMAQINKHITFHTARHTFAMQMLEKTKNIYLVKKLCGHKKITTTEQYLHMLRLDDELENIEW